MRAPTTSLTSLTGYEPNGPDFNELQNSSVLLSFKIPGADQDVDDLTLGKMLTEAYRGQVDYFVQGSVSVSQLSSSVRSDRAGQPDGDRSGQPDEHESSKAQTGLYMRSKDRQVLRNIAKKSVITNFKQLKPKKSADSYKDNNGDRIWNFVKLINKVLQRWRELRKFQSSTFDTIARRKLIEDQTLFWNSRVEYRNCKTKQIA